MFISIKNQVYIILFLLLSLTIAQAYFSTLSSQTYSANVEKTQATLKNIIQVKTLQTEVIDLQRNVLIYKQTGSQSAIERFNELLADLIRRLETLQSTQFDEQNQTQYLDYLQSMLEHLKAYRENFAQVVSSRKNRESLFQTNVLDALENIRNNIISFQNPVLIEQSEKIERLLLAAENAAFQYLASPDYQYIEDFNQAILNLQLILKPFSDQETLVETSVSLSSSIKTDFYRLTQLTTGYVFLINVVMTGSANEFLFVSRQLAELVEQQQANINLQTKTEANHILLKNLFLTAAAITITLFTALILGFRVLMPINSMSKIFRKLSSGEYVEKLPSIERKDEIGELAQAASVFQNKNEQTESLLKQAQKQNERHRQMNEELADAKIKAEQATESKSMFLANMSHEIRTPLNGVIGLLDLCLKTDLNFQQKEYLSKALFSGQILMNVINDILDFSKIEAGKLDIESVNFSFNRLIESLLSNMSVRVKDKPVKIKLHVDPNLPVQLKGDPIRISQVILNLTNNAIKFTERGYVQLSFAVEADLQQDSILFKASVEDTGIGMTEQQLSRIFNSFTQADGGTSRKYGGTGLGLSIVKQLVELMNGEVHASSIPGQGTRFDVSFRLQANKAERFIDVLDCPVNKIWIAESQTGSILSPVTLTEYGLIPNIFSHKSLQTKTFNQQSLLLIELASLLEWQQLKDKILQLNQQCKLLIITDENEVAVELPAELNKLLLPAIPGQLIEKLNQTWHPDKKALQATSNQATETKFKGHVLLVDDNDINRIVAGEMLASFGVEFDEAQNGQEAVEKIIQKPDYDMVFMDIQMPVLDGYQATQKIIEQGFTELKICGLSANAMKQDFDRAFANGMVDYMTKPLQVEDIKNILAKYLTPA